MLMINLENKYFIIIAFYYYYQTTLFVCYSAQLQWNLFTVVLSNGTLLSKNSSLWTECCQINPYYDYLIWSNKSCYILCILNIWCRKSFQMWNYINLHNRVIFNKINSSLHNKQLHRVYWFHFKEEFRVLFRIFLNFVNYEYESEFRNHSQ